MTRDQRGDEHPWRRRFFFLQRRHTKTPQKLLASLAAGTLLVLVCSSVAESRYLAVDVVLDEFNFHTTHSYDPLYDAFSGVLNSTVPRLTYAGHVYLGAKDSVPFGSPPGRWIKLPIRGETEEDRATLAFSDSDMQLRAFQNNQGTWHAFLGYEHLFPGAIVLNSPTLDETYSRLVPGGHENVYTVPLGRDAAAQAARTLGRCRHGTTPEPLLKTALVQFMVMVSEALRFRAIREQFSSYDGRWETESRLTELQAKYVAHWPGLSQLLLIWERDNVWDADTGLGKLIREEICVSNADEAMEIVDFLRRPNSLRVL